MGVEDGKNSFKNFLKMKVTQKIATLLQILLAFCACTDNIIPVKVESVILDKEELTITEGEKKLLTATVLPENAENQTIYWSSNKNDVATVEDGVVTAISPGTAIITAISDDGGRKALCVVTVVEKPISVTGLSLDRENARVFINGSLTLVASILPADATNKTLLWKSDDESVATVADGVVTGIALGRTSIWVETGDGTFKAECVIDVVEERQTQSKGPMTLDLGKVTATTAVLSGVLDIDLTAGYDMTGGGVGFIYAPVGVELNVDSAQKVQITNVDYANGFSKTLTGLQRDTEYQYTIFLYKNNICQYGKTQTFKTKDAVITVDNVAVTYTTATLSGKVEREECDADVKVGIQYSTDEDFSSGSIISFEIAPQDGAYSKTIEQFDINTTYYYRTYTCHNNVYKYGEHAAFTTNSVEVELSAGSITKTSVTITGKINPITALDEVIVAIIANNSETVNRTNYTNISVLKSSDIGNNGAFSIKWYVLPGETYHYAYYILNNGAYSYGETQTFTTEELNVTIAVDNITQTTAEFIGNIGWQESDVLEVGILYSTSSNDLEVSNLATSTILLNGKQGLDGNYKYKVTGLLHETTYYYRYYIKQRSLCVYGEVMSFKTENVPVIIEIESIDKNVVTFKGNVQFTEQGGIELGIQYYPKSTTSQYATMQPITQISANGDFTIEISKLLNATEYFWQYYLLQNGLTTIGEPQSFAITDLYNIQSELNVPSAIDLSSSASANCYIVSEAGLYKFKTLKGNSNESVGSVSSAAILWETFGTSTMPDCFELLDKICYSDGYIAFQTSDTFKEGNAVIAAKDVSGNILWSWHIWLTDPPQEQIYKNNAGTMMDRNIGATSAEPGDVGALGLLYQWGRKDPFLGSSSINDEVDAKSTIVWPSAVESNASNGTITYATANPTTLIKSNGSNYDWYYTGDDSSDDYRWTTSKVAKSIYDPCPTGWRVPDRGVWSKACGSTSSSFTTQYKSSNAGINFSGKFGSASTIWYPASGYRRAVGLSDVDYLGQYWSASPFSVYASCLYFDSDGLVGTSSYSSRAGGNAVRCIQE